MDLRYSASLKRNPRELPNNSLNGTAFVVPKDSEEHEMYEIHGIL
jgi:hypothetical protein